MPLAWALMVMLRPVWFFLCCQKSILILVSTSPYWPNLNCTRYQFIIYNQEARWQPFPSWVSGTLQIWVVGEMPDASCRVGFDNPKIESGNQTLRQREPHKCVWEIFRFMGSEPHEPEIRWDPCFSHSVFYTCCLRCVYRTVYLQFKSK